MPLTLGTDALELDTVIGPMPNFNITFERFFIEKSAQLLLNKPDNASPEPNESIMADSDDLTWMYQIQLANNSQQQNFEIIYNNNNVYYKATRRIEKNETLFAFPSKDLEISLGLMFVPARSDENYSCKKCMTTFCFTNHLMLHARYFCNMKTLRSQLESTLDNQSLLKRKCLDGHGSAKARKVVSSELPVKDSLYERQNNFLLEYLQSLALFNSSRNSILDNPKLKSLNVNELVNQTGFNYYENIIANNQSTQNIYFKEIMSKLESYSNKLSIRSATSENPGKKSIESEPTTSRPIYKPIPIFTTPNTKTWKEDRQKTYEPSTNMTLNPQTFQNWCAKCNTHFRLTSDLVYHMRTFHRKYDQVERAKPIKNSATYDNNHLDTPQYDIFELSKKILKASIPKDQSASTSKTSRENKFLKCEICFEVFKEKHHLSRHMTSHR